MQLTNEKLKELATKIAEAVAKNAGTAPELCHAPTLFVLQDALQQQDGQPMEDDEIFEAANEHGSGRTTTGSYLFRPAALLNFVRSLRLPASLIERPAGAVPAGYRLVAIEPRPECCDEGKDGSEVCCGNGKCAYLQEVESARDAVATVLASLPPTSSGPVPTEQAAHRAALQYVAMGDTVIDQIAATSNRQTIYRMFGRDATLAFVRAIEFEVLARCCISSSPAVAQPETIYTVKSFAFPNAWHDVPKAEYDRTPPDQQRIVYTVPPVAVAQPVADERMRQAIGTLRWMLNVTEDRPDATAAELFDETFTGDLKTSNRQTLEWLWAYLDPKNSRAALCLPAGTAHPVPEDVLALHHKLAGETLRADQGWARYKAANAARNAAEAALAEMYPQALRRLLELIGEITKHRYQMSYNDSYFGEPAGLLKRTVRDIEKLLDRVRGAPAPGDGPPVAAKAATVHKRIDALCTAANTPGGDYFDAGTCLMLAVRELLVTLGYPHSFDIDAALAAKDKP